MRIGIPKEIKKDEYRVAVVPAGVKALREAGHEVVVERGAGAGSSIPDGEFEAAGARIGKDAGETWSGADLVLKVKEPRPEEYRFFRDGLAVFTFFHLAADTGLAEELLARKVTAVAYETLETDDGRLPVLAPMSEVAGRLSVQAGAHHLLKPYGGRGVLLGGVPGVERGNVAVIGAGVVGKNAARVARGLGADVAVLDIDLEKLRHIEEFFKGTVRTLASNTYNVEKTLAWCDLLVGAVHRPGARTPTIVTREMLALMKEGSVVVDVSVDQGGCVETIRPTTHSEPTYVVEGVVHYGVANMPGALPRTSTFALTNATLPFALKLAGLGVVGAARKCSSIARAVNTHCGLVTHPSVAEAVGRPHTPLTG